MWVFVDDSGDCGFDFDGGSSPYLVIAACVFTRADNMAKATELVEEARWVERSDGQRFRRNREFKYSSCKADHKDVFFRTLRAASYRVRVIYADKRRIYSKYLLNNPNDMKSYFIRQLLTHTLETVRDAKLVVDGRDTRAFGMSDRNYFLRKVNEEAPGTLSEVEFADSKRNNLIQLADMTAGSMNAALQQKSTGLAHADTYRKRTRWPYGSQWDFTQ